LIQQRHLTGQDRFLIQQRHLTGQDRFLIQQRHLTGQDRFLIFKAKPASAAKFGDPEILRNAKIPKNASLKVVRHSLRKTVIKLPLNKATLGFHKLTSSAFNLRL
jgi:hypothetical protein